MITRETKIKDIIPEGYEFNSQSLNETEYHISLGLQFKKKEKTAIELAKELGFILTTDNEPIFEVYNDKDKLEFDSDGWISNNKDIIYAPTQSLVQKWLREEKGVHINIYLTDDFGDERYNFEFISTKHYTECNEFSHQYWENLQCTYEEALEMALLVALEEIKDYTTVKP